MRPTNLIKYHRTQNAFRNVAFGVFFKMLNIIGAFVSRSMIIYLLGIEYIGLDGIFVSVLNLLNMAEMGFSSAVVFLLYKPISEGNTTLVDALIAYYKKIYKTIGFIVLGLGLCIIPFLKTIINKDSPDNVNIYALYIIYLANTCVSYWMFAYKTAILSANQREDLVSRVYSIAYLIKYVVQFVLLLVFRNYYAYAIMIPVCTIVMNVGTAIVAHKFYPQYVGKGSLPDDYKTLIKTKIKALMYNKLGVAIITGSDNIVISYFLGLGVLGIYDSYYYIFSMLYSIFAIFYSSIAGGIGNSIATESVEQNYKLFKRLNFVNYWAVGWCAITLCCLYKPFMELWIGEKNTFPFSFSILMSVYFCLYMIRFITISFKNALGLWYEDRFRALIESIVNLCLNILLVNICGIYGITFSTVIAMIVISYPWETLVLFKKYFKQGAKEYFITQITGILVLLLIAIVTFICSSLVYAKGVFNIVLKLIVCFALPNFIIIVLFHKTSEFKYCTNKIIGKIRRHKN